jgi:uncharacterized membrane protein YsdA (DUF1294 family)
MDLLASLTHPSNLALVLPAINFFAFAAFGADKILAENGMRRISEAALLRLAFFGGTIGAYAGRSLFRHKTRKQPFSDNLHIIAGVQLCAAAFSIAYFW